MKTRNALAAIGLLLCGIVAMQMPALAAQNAANNEVSVEGTIVSIRGKILIVRPSLRPVITRVSFDDKTEVIASERGSKAMLKSGMRVGMQGRYNEQNGFRPRWIECADTPLGWLAKKSDGLEIDKQDGSARAWGTLKSVAPFVFVDDAGKEHTANIDRIFGVWHDYKSDKNNLLIGVRIEASGTKAPDGVIKATRIVPDRNFAKVGTMFGEIVAVNGSAVEIRPRYTTDKLKIERTPNCILQRQISYDPDSIKIGDRVTFWGEHRNMAISQGDPNDFKAIALLLGTGRYPATEGKNMPVFLTGKMTSIEPVKFQPDSGKLLNILVPAQMPIARLVSIASSDLKPGAQVMLVLSRRKDGSFETTQIILDASPWVGYGG